VADAIRGHLSSGGQKHELVMTRGPGHAEVLIRETVACGESTVVVAGGDGTLGEAAQVLAGTGVMLGILPLGTGNDLARSLGLPCGRLREALRILQQGCVREVDLGRDRERVFVSVLGVGFPAAVALRANRYRFLRGSMAFACAVYTEITRMKVFKAKIRLDQKAPFEAAVTSILIQNTPTTGGGMKTAPGAAIDDGFLEVLVVNDISKLALTWNFPKVYRGRHLSNPHFRAYRCQSVELDCPAEVGKMGDGEPWSWAPLAVRVEPGSLRVLVNPETQGHQ
jgi:diacylglycerol kinase (ATP)